MSTELVNADKVLHRDQHVQIILPHNTFPVEGEIYTLTDTNMMIDVDRLSVPVGFVPPERGTEATITFCGRDCVYRVVLHLTDDLTEHERMWRFERPRRLIREQKRKYFRVPVKLPIRLSMAGGTGAFDNSVYSETVDISAGGVCFVAPQSIPVGQTIFVILEKLPGLNSFPVLGDVVRCANLEEAGKGWKVALNMESHLPENLHDQLAASVATLHRAYLKEKLAER